MQTSQTDPNSTCKISGKDRVSSCEGTFFAHRCPDALATDLAHSYDDLWKVERKVYHSFLNINIAKKYAPYQDLETKQLCVDLLRDPDHWAELIARTTTSVATSMTYGFRVTDLKNPVMVEMYKNTHGFFRMVYTSKFLDWYPQLRPFVKLLPTWIFPLVRRATETYHRERAQFGQLYSDAKRGQNSDSLPSTKAQVIYEMPATY